MIRDLHTRMLFSSAVLHGSMASNSSDASIDFSLVWTYIPGLLLLLRNLVLLCVYTILVIGLPMTPVTSDHIMPYDIIILIMIMLVYLDGWFFRSDTLSRASGFLAPTLLLIITMSASLYPHARTCSHMTAIAVYYITSVVWAVSSSYCVVDMLFRLQTFNVFVAAVFWSMACVVIVYVDCYKKSIFEIVVRSALYYTLAVVLWFSQKWQHNIDRNRFSFTILHTALHVLFVDRFCVGVTVFVWLCIFIYHYRKQHSQSRKSTPSFHPSKPENTNSLLQELEAAKRAGGLL